MITLDIPVLQIQLSGKPAGEAVAQFFAGHVLSFDRAMKGKEIALLQPRVLPTGVASWICEANNPTLALWRLDLSFWHSTMMPKAGSLSSVTVFPKVSYALRFLVREGPRYMYEVVLRNNVITTFWVEKPE